MAMGGKQTSVQGGELPAQPALEDRVAQLQQALDSRVVIEQAKGILRERFQITLDQAFQVLRTTARHNRQSLRQLAQQIVDHSDTPGAIVQTLARQPHDHGSLDAGLHERAQIAQTRRRAKGLRDDAQALKSQAKVQVGRAKRNLGKGQT